MLSEFFVYLRLGLEHILDLRGLDHILFVMALTAPYTVREGRSVVIQVTAFTVGHSLTLALATLDVVRVSTAWVEFLIPVTIAATAAVQLRAVLGPATPVAVDPVTTPVGFDPVTTSAASDASTARSAGDDPGGRGGMPPSSVTWLMALGFGLIHGLGFSNFLRAILGDAGSIVGPLFAFNVGLEAGQLVIVAIMLALTTGLIRSRALSRTAWVGILSTAIGLVALYLSVTRLPL